MSTASARSAGAWGGDSEASPGTRVARWSAGAVAAVLLVATIAWWLGWFGLATDPRLVEIRTLQTEAQRQFAAQGGPNTLAEASAAVAAMNAIREKVESLPEPLRDAARQNGGNFFRSTMRARINAYFALPPAERQGELDRQIKQEELFRQAWEAARSPRQASGDAAAGAGAAGSTAAAGGPGGGAASPGGPGFGGPPRGGSEEDRNRWRKNIIDTTSPEQRARYVEYRRAMDARRSQLGLAPRGPR